MKFNISQDGVIFAPNPDGTVTKYGRIGADGQLADAYGTPLVARGASGSPRRRPVWGYWLTIILLLLAGGVGGYAFMRLTEDKARLEQELKQAGIKACNDAGALRHKEQLIEKLQTELETANRSRFEAERTLSEIAGQAAGVTPLLVTGIDFRNMNGNGKPLSAFGTVPKASELQFLQASVSYYGLATGMHTFRIRIIGPGGVVGGGEWSFSSERPVETGAGHSFNLSGFGYSGHGWPQGRYSYELWYGKSRIAVKNFML